MSRKYFGTDGIRGRVGEGVISADLISAGFLISMLNLPAFSKHVP